MSSDAVLQSIRLGVQTKKGLQAIADQWGMSANKVIEYILREHMKTEMMTDLATPTRLQVEFNDDTEQIAAFYAVWLKARQCEGGYQFRQAEIDGHVDYLVVEVDSAGKEKKVVNPIQLIG